MKLKTYAIFTHDVFYHLLKAYDPEDAVERALKDVGEWDEDEMELDTCWPHDQDCLFVFEVSKDYTGKAYDRDPQREFARLRAERPESHYHTVAKEDADADL
jgi:hypothetical protein